MSFVEHLFENAAFDNGLVNKHDQCLTRVLAALTVCVIRARRGHRKGKKMSKKEITITIDAEAADWLASEVSSHFFWGSVEIHDYDHFMPMVTIYKALMAAGVSEPERESEKNRREMAAHEAAKAGEK